MKVIFCSLIVLFSSVSAYAEDYKHPHPNPHSSIQARTEVVLTQLWEMELEDMIFECDDVKASTYHSKAEQRLYCLERMHVRYFVERVTGEFPEW
jgi:hypothetical protein